MNPFDKILVKTPKFSRYDQHNTNKLTMEIGDLVPIWFKDMTPNEQIRLKISSLVKTTPMLAPVMDRLKLECFAFFVPYRILGWDSEKFFNLSTPIEERPAMPTLKPVPGVISMLGNSNVLSGSYNAFDQSNKLIDYLGCSTFQDFQDAIWKNLNTYHDLLTFNSNANIYAQSSTEVFDDYDNQLNSFSHFVDPADPDNPVSFHWNPSDVNVAPLKFYNWLVYKYLSATIPDLEPDSETPIDYDITNIQDVIDVTLPFLGYDSIEAAFGYYRNYLISVLLSQYYDEFPTINAFIDDSDDGLALRESVYCSSLTKRVYHRIVADWFLNTNIEDYDDYLDSYVYHDYPDLRTSSAVKVTDSYKLKKRCWENDYFTSAFASTQSGTDVPIPVNGSIKDLRNANALQKVMELVLYSGRRYIDQIRTFFGAKSSDARLDRAEVIGKSDFVFGIDEVIQQSESSVDSKLGSYAGRGLTAGKDGMFSYKCEEHGMIMILANIKPLVSYMNIVDRFYLKNSPYDFLLPQFSQVGEQPIYMREIYDGIPYDTSLIGEVFGYQRRYAEYMFKHNEVHGNFRGSLDYWTMARKFDTKPALNSEFIHITKKDDYNRVFAVPDGPDHFMCYFVFEYQDANALPRYINYDL